MQLSAIFDPTSVRDIDAAIDELVAIKNRLVGQAAIKAATGMAYSGVVDTTKWPAAVQVSDMNVDEALADLWPRLGLTLRKLLKAAAAFDRPYSTHELAVALATDVATAKSWRANLGRSMNAVLKAHPEAPTFFEQHAQPGGGWRYSVRPEYRPLIAAMDLEDSETLPQ